MTMLRVAGILAVAIGCLTQAFLCHGQSQSQTTDKQINVNWLYGSYIPKGVPRLPLNGHQRAVLYVRQTYTTPGIYVKTTFFVLRDQAADTYPQWGDGFGGFAKRLGTAKFNSSFRTPLHHWETAWSDGSRATTAAPA